MTTPAIKLLSPQSSGDRTNAAFGRSQRFFHVLSKSTALKCARSVNLRADGATSAAQLTSEPKALRKEGLPVPSYLNSTPGVSHVYRSV